MQHLEMEREIRGLKEKVAMQVELSRGLKEEVAIIKTQLSRMDTCLQKAEVSPHEGVGEAFDIKMFLRLD